MNTPAKTSVTIVSATAYLVDVEVERVRTDAVQSFVKQETIFVEISASDGGAGTGYSYTIGTGGRAVLALLRDSMLPRLIGQDPRRVEADLARPVRRQPRHHGRRDHLARARRGRHRAVGSALRGRRPTPVGVRRRSQGPRAALRHRGRLAAPGDRGAGRRCEGQPGGRLGRREDQGGPVAGRRRRTARRRPRRGRPRDGPHGRRQPVADRGRGDPARPAAGAVRPRSGSRSRCRPTTSPGTRRWPRPPRIPIAVGESMYSVGQFADYLTRRGRRHRAGRRGPDRRHHAVAQGRPSGRGTQRPGLPTLPDGTARQPVLCGSEQPLPGVHPAVARDHHGARSTSTAAPRSRPTAPGLGIDWDRDAIDDRRVQ